MLGTANLNIKSFKAEGNKITSIDIYYPEPKYDPDNKVYEETYTLEEPPAETVKFLCWKYVDSSENVYILFTKSTDAIPTSGYVTTAANAVLDEVAVTYEQSTPAVLYNGNVYTRYLSGDITF